MLKQALADGRIDDPNGALSTAMQEIADLHRSLKVSEEDALTLVSRIMAQCKQLQH